MKNQSQARKKDSKISPSPQVQMGSNPVPKLETVRKSPDPKQRPNSGEELLRYKEMRVRKLRSPVNIELRIPGPSEWSDVRLACFLAHILRVFGADLWHHVFANLKADDQAWFGDVCRIAEKINQWEADPSKAFPSEFCMIGLGSFQKIPSHQWVLDEMAYVFDNHRDVILSLIAPTLCAVGRIEIIEALAVAQFVCDRAGGDPEVEACESTHRPTALAKLCWNFKADFYRRNFEDQWDKLQRDLEEDRASYGQKAA